MERYNCPNCGAPITSMQCPYCETILFDFAELDRYKPMYIRLNLGNQKIMFRAFMTDIEVQCGSGACQVVTTEFHVLPEEILIKEV